MKHWRYHLKQALEVVNEVSSVAVHFRGPPIVNQIAVVANIVQTIASKSKYDARDLFHGWIHEPAIHVLTKEVYKEVKAHFRAVPVEKIGLASDTDTHGDKVELFQVKEDVLGFIIDEGIACRPSIHPDGDPKRVLRNVRACIWESLGDCATYEQSGFMESRSSLCAHSFKSFDCALAPEIWDIQKRYKACGHSRAVLLYGEPGTGKTNTAYELGKLAGGRMLKLSMKNIGTVSNFQKTVTLLRPSVIIFDDVDRAGAALSVIEELDNLIPTGSLVIGTANFKSQLDSAVLRRFDEAIECNTLDKTMVAKIDQDALLKHRELLKTLPIVYVARYFKLMESLPVDLVDRELEKIVSLRSDAHKKWTSTLEVESEEDDYES